MAENEDVALVQWILIGGPLHGLMVELQEDARSASLSLAQEGEAPEHLYKSAQVVWRGNVYRMGLHNPTEDELADVGGFIDNHGTRPLRAWTGENTIH